MAKIVDKSFVNSKTHELFSVNENCEREILSAQICEYNNLKLALYLGGTTTNFEVFESIKHELVRNPTSSLKFPVKFKVTVILFDKSSAKFPVFVDDKNSTNSKLYIKLEFTKITPTGHSGVQKLYGEGAEMGV